MCTSFPIIFSSSFTKVTSGFIPTAAAECTGQKVARRKGKIHRVDPKFASWPSSLTEDPCQSLRVGPEYGSTLRVNFRLHTCTSALYGQGGGGWIGPCGEGPGCWAPQSPPASSCLLACWCRKLLLPKALRGRPEIWDPAWSQPTSTFIIETRSVTACGTL
jgi:hypothetical protein